MYLDEFIPGSRVEIGRRAFSAQEIVAFARRFDPQPFHLSEEGGRASHFGGLVASGWQSCTAWMRFHVAWLARTAEERRAAGLPMGRMGPSPGIRDLTWFRPVRPDLMLVYATEIVETRPSASRPGWGLLTARASAADEDGRPYTTFLATAFVEAR